MEFCIFVETKRTMKPQTPTYSPEPNGVTADKMTLMDMLKLLEKDVRKTEKASEKFQKTCDSLGFIFEF